jgi:hypothetical protein
MAGMRRSRITPRPPAPTGSASSPGGGTGGAYVLGLDALANAAPTAGDDAATLEEDTAVTLDLAGNDADADGAIDPATVVVVDLPSHGGLSIDPATGRATYTPAAHFSGTDRFSYAIRDDNGATSGVATVP